MVDLLPPNLDDNTYALAWQQALDDLASASANGEITHVQLRTFWRIDPAVRSTWEYPELGAVESAGQQAMCDNWQTWIFGTPTYGSSAAKRIHDAGFQLEFCLTTAWTDSGTVADATPVFDAGAKEADYNFDGDLFLRNYMDNCLRPMAQFLASSQNFQNGDIFMLAFELCYPSADFMWLHNARWAQMIIEVRQIFSSVGKTGVMLTVDVSSWWDDQGLGYDSVKLQKPDAPIYETWKGISGATYLSQLDFISVSHWLPLLRLEDVPTIWSDSDVSWVAQAWRDNMNYFKLGTGYNVNPGVFGRDFIADYAALSTVLGGKKILMNSGWKNAHGTLVNPHGGGAVDNVEQKIAWAAQLLALKGQSWCAGQDFERYCRDKAAQPTTVDTSWRKASAEQAIMAGIRNVLSTTPITEQPIVPLAENETETEIPVPFEDYAVGDWFESVRFVTVAMGMVFIWAGLRKKY